MKQVSGNTRTLRTIIYKKKNLTTYSSYICKKYDLLFKFHSFWFIRFHSTFVINSVINIFSVNGTWLYFIKKKLLRVLLFSQWIFLWSLILEITDWFTTWNCMAYIPCLIGVVPIESSCLSPFDPFAVKVMYSSNLHSRTCHGQLLCCWFTGRLALCQVK